MENFCMANDIKAAFDEAFADGPTSSPTQVNKSTVRTLVGGKVQTEIDALRGIINSGFRTFTTKAEMDLNLAFADGTIAIVFEQANKGVYRKSGASGVGSWVYYYALPYAGVMGDLSFAGWGDLSVTIGDYNGQTARVTNDGGSHFDTINGTTVSNMGIYSWADEVNYWRWVGFLNTNIIQVRGWTDLEGIPGTYNGQPGKVINDGGSHLDTVLGVNVPNAGEYTWAAVATKWVWAQNVLTPAALADAATAKAQAEASAVAAASSATTAGGYASQALVARDAANAAASAIGPQNFYDTYAAANADIAAIPNLAIVEVLADEGQNGERSRYRKESGALVLKLLLPQYVKAAADPQRNYVTITAPDLGPSHFIDNVLAIQNKSRGAGDTQSGNAAINFLDRAGIERGAIGYSRNASLAPLGGYYSNTLYIEFGNPFTTDSDVTNFRLINTIKAGGPYWGGAGSSYFAMEVFADTGRMNFRAPGTGGIYFERGPQFGFDGVPQTVSFALTNIKARVREDLSLNEFAITTNDASMGQGGASALVQDAPSAASWRLAMFGASDTFRILRAAPGAANRTAYAEYFRINANGDVITSSGMVGQSVKVSGTNGQLAVTSLSGPNPAITAKGAGLSGAPVLLLWNPAATGDNVFASFCVDATLTARGSIAYNRTANVVAYNTTSDRRAKDVYGEIEDAVDRLMAIKAYRGRMHGAEIDMDMFIADELQKVAPYAVIGEPDGEDFQQLDASKLMPLLVAVTQRLVALQPNLH
jgi:hypothetical protein